MAPDQPISEAIRSRRSRRLRTALTLVTLVAASAGSLIASTPAQAAESYFCSDNTQPYVPVAVAEAYPAGEAVTGLSVTKGTTPDKFTGTYVGFIADALGKGKDLLLFRLSSETIDGTSTTRGAGIWAGMSGSPVYDSDGRLIGAVAYSLTTENLPIAGVTPAEYMKSIGSTGFSPTSKIKTTSANLKISAKGTEIAGASLNGSSFTQIRTEKIAGPAGAAANAFVNRTFARTPAGSGVASFLRGKNFQPAGSTSTSGVPSTLVAGGTVAALYASGDLATGAIGTVTAVCGTSVWAFGHPMAHQGKAQMLMANASTALIVPDSAGFVGSYKQVSKIGAPIGMVTQDRLVGIKGTVGPVRIGSLSVQVQNASRVKIADYRANYSEPLVLASATAVLTGQAAYQELDQDGSGSAEVSWTINYTRADGSAESLTNSKFVSDPDYVADAVGNAPAADVDAILSNKFEDVSITKVAVTVRLISTDSVTYQAKGLQVRLKGRWADLDGLRLKRGTTYLFRPAFATAKNGRPGKVITGGLVKVKLSTKATKAGNFTLSNPNQPIEDCVKTPIGTVCSEEQSAAIDSATSFDELISVLDSVDPGNQATGVLTYKLKKGSAAKDFSWKTPGVFTGSASADFTIRK